MGRLRTPSRKVAPKNAYIIGTIFVSPLFKGIYIMQQTVVYLKKEAAEKARISLNALNTLIKQGKIPQVNLTARRRGVLECCYQRCKNDPLTTE
jgi:hypothetical protein